MEISGKEFPPRRESFSPAGMVLLERRVMHHRPVFLFLEISPGIWQLIDLTVDFVSPGLAHPANLGDFEVEIS